MEDQEYKIPTFSKPKPINETAADLLSTARKHLTNAGMIKEPKDFPVKVAPHVPADTIESFKPSSGESRPNDLNKEEIEYITNFIKDRFGSYTLSSSEANWLTDLILDEQEDSFEDDRDSRFDSFGIDDEDDDWNSPF